jgi:hypothetical protein
MIIQPEPQIADEGKATTAGSTEQRKAPSQTQPRKSIHKEAGKKKDSAENRQRTKLHLYTTPPLDSTG